MPLDTEAWREIRQLVDILQRLGIRYVIGGSMASSSQGAPRSTNDVDVMVTRFSGREQQFVAEFGAGYYVSLSAVVEANQRQRSFNVVNTNTGFKLDIFIEKPRAFDKQAFNRAVLRRLLGGDDEFRVLSVEDVVLTKLEWYRLGNEVSDRQWEDVIGVLKSNWSQFDRQYCAEWAKHLGVDDLLQRVLGETEVRIEKERKAMP